VQSVVWLSEGSSTLSTERERRSGCSIYGVTEEGDVLCGTAVAAMLVFPQDHNRILNILLTQGLLEMKGLQGLNYCIL
jgi:hypothetical protein